MDCNKLFFSIKNWSALICLFSIIDKTCGIANKPTSAAIIFIPPENIGLKTNLSTPNTESYPMVANHKPIAPEKSPFIIELESSVAITVTPKIAIQNICEGPNLRAKFANTGVKKIKIIIPTTPPTNELIKQ